jgi:hypothetical protein
VSGLRLNLGCGSRPLDGFVNVDPLEAPGVDVVADAGGSLPFENGEADLAYASRVLEHLPAAVVPVVLREWGCVLGEGGQPLVAVPDLDRIAQLLRSRSGWFIPPNEPWVGLVYRGQKDELDFHKTGFTAPSLAPLLDNAGFGSVERVERFTVIGANYGSWLPFPFGLNMRAVAGAVRLLVPERFNFVFDAVDSALTFALRGSALLRARLMQRRRRRLEDAVGASDRRRG